VKPKELKAIRDAMGLTQAELADRLKIARNTVARMERSLQAITPSMALLISFVAREAGVETPASHSRPGSRAAPDKGAHGRKTRDSSRKGGGRPRS
jgi:transcriptional regulator with XRE-family HTH domain